MSISPWPFTVWREASGILLDPETIRLLVKRGLIDGAHQDEKNGFAVIPSVYNQKGSCALCWLP